MTLDRAGVTDWVRRYEQQWRTPGTSGLAALFVDDVSYSASPWTTPVRGLAALAAFWDAEREGADEGFTMAFDVLAVDGDLGVVRVAVDYETGDRWRDLWLIRLDAQRRCVAFEEWPFAPDGTDGH